MWMAPFLNGDEVALLAKIAAAKDSNFYVKTCPKTPNLAKRPYLVVCSVIEQTVVRDVPEGASSNLETYALSDTFAGVVSTDHLGYGHVSSKLN